MPYTHKKIKGKNVVYKKENGKLKRVGSTEGTKEALRKYMAALNIHSKDKMKKESKTLKENEQLVVQDSPEDPYSHPNPAPHPGCEDKIGDIFVVLKPKADSEPENIVQKTHAFGMRHIDPMGVHGVYNDENEANLTAESAIKELHKNLRTIEEKKDTILKKLGKHITRLHKEVKGHLKEAEEKPNEAKVYHELAQKKMATIRELNRRHKIVKESKRELPKEKE